MRVRLSSINGYRVRGSVDGIITAATERVAPANATQAKPQATHDAVPLDRLQRILRARWLVATMRRQQRRYCKLVEADQAEEEQPHEAGRLRPSIATRRLSSSRRHPKDAVEAAGWAKTTRLTSVGAGSSRQICRSRLRTRLRTTALPSDLRRTKMTPERSRPARIQRTGPFVHDIAGASRRRHAQTARRLRPRRRRRERIARPAGVRMRLRKPCLFRRRRRLGW